jgi:uncharacterized protein (TIGR00645 family)
MGAMTNLECPPSPAANKFSENHFSPVAHATIGPRPEKSNAMTESKNTQSKRTLSSLIFLSRWLQAPLYFGLIVAQAVYVYHFVVELWHLIDFAVMGGTPPPSVPASLATAAVINVEVIVMLTVLGLIDVVMIANLLIMVIVGGYETFVSRLNLQGHPDQPEWLSHVNAGVLKVKLATALIGISSIHLLKTFINAENLEEGTMFWQVVIHITFVLSALILAWIDRLTYHPPKPAA